jgi:hypothetical protein
MRISIANPANPAIWRKKLLTGILARHRPDGNAIRKGVNA